MYFECLRECVCVMCACYQCRCVFLGFNNTRRFVESVCSKNKRNPFWIHFICINDRRHRYTMAWLPALASSSFWLSSLTIRRRCRCRNTLYVICLCITPNRHRHYILTLYVVSSNLDFMMCQTIRKCLHCSLCWCRVLLQDMRAQPIRINTRV